MTAAAFRCLDVVHAAKLQGEKRIGQELAFLCPNHDDHDPSLKINDTKDVFLCKPCNQQGTAWQLAAFLSHHAPDDKPAVTAWLREVGLFAGNGHEHHPSNLETTARREVAA